MPPVLDDLAARVREAAQARTPLAIRAGGTKDFYGNEPRGEPFDPRAYAGIVAYEPTELVVTARCGTPLAELEATLHAQGQMLAFEPPHFGQAATVGGCVAAGLAGPRRASYGATYGGVRDYVLGARLIDGRGQLLSFGGTVMKNVAGYDVARALAGSLGILGLIVEVSIKVLPRPVAEATLRFRLDEPASLERTNTWGGLPLPVSATAWRDGELFVRLSGAEAAVRAAQATMCGEALDAATGASLWRGVREHTDAFFVVNAPLWRISVPSTAEPLQLDGAQLIEWGGALRWLRSSLPAAQIRQRAAALGGHATLFRGGDRSIGVFTPLAPPLAAIHKRLKAEFDPSGIFNPGRMYENL
jgi:glycolate oxidase FAD binding subunit